MESTPTGEETLEAGPAAVRENDAVPRGQWRRRRRRVAVVMTGGLVLGGAVYVTTTQGEQRRRLTPSLMTTSYVRRYTVGGYDNKASWLTGEDLRTKAGVVPSITCQPGRYRPTGASDNNFQRLVSLRADGCADCPRGRYGDAAGLVSEFCSADCPAGKYRDKPGAKSESECFECPPGKYGATMGLTTNKCTASCPAGKFSNKWGVADVQECQDCAEGQRISGSSTWRQCDWEITPQRFARGYVPGTGWLHVHHYDLDTNPAAKVMAHRGTHENPGVRIDEYEVGIRRDHPVWFARQYEKIFPHPKGEYAGLGPDPDRAPASDNRVPGPLPNSAHNMPRRPARPLRHMPPGDATLRLPFKFPLRNTGYPRDDD